VSESVCESVVERPGLRRSNIATAKLGATDVHVSLSCWGGAPREVFIDLDYREGSPVREMLRALSIGASRALQSGVKLTDILKDWRRINGQPGVVTECEGITFAQSVPDLAAQMLERMAGG